MHPAGLERAPLQDEKRWKADRLRFPPYAYQYWNGVINGWRMLDVVEKRINYGLPQGTTPYKVSDNPTRLRPMIYL